GSALYRRRRAHRCGNCLRNVWTTEVRQQKGNKNMKGRSTVAVPFLLSLITACYAEAGAINCDGRWHRVPVVDLAQRGGDFDSLNGVAAISPADIWAVGQFRRFAQNDYDHTLVEHWDGTSWTPMLTPHPSLPICILYGVAATGPD